MKVVRSRINIYLTVSVPSEYESNNITPRGNTLILKQGNSNPDSRSERRYETVKLLCAEINS